MKRNNKMLLIILAILVVVYIFRSKMSGYTEMEVWVKYGLTPRNSDIIEKLRLDLFQLKNRIKQSDTDQEKAELQIIFENQKLMLMSIYKEMGTLLYLDQQKALEFANDMIEQYKV